MTNMPSSAPAWINALAQRFVGNGIRAIVLMGSYARGDAGPYSDVDLVRFTAGSSPEPTGAGSHLVDGQLVVVSDVSPDQVEAWFARPEIAVDVIAGAQAAQILIDDGGYFAAIQARARAFVWDEAMQDRANRWASQQLVGWIEEVQKGLEGLRRCDTGRLLNARFGLSWGLTGVVKVQRGLLLSGDNAFYDETATALGASGEWVRQRGHAYGIEGDAGIPLPLREQVLAGLRLYVLTADLLAPVLQPEDAPLIRHTVDLITEYLGR